MVSALEGHAARRGPAFTPAQEFGNALTHWLGAALSVAGLVVLVVQAALRGDAWFIVSYAIFGSSMIILYMASALYHSIRAPALKRLFEKFDHAAIFVLIAGSYTAFALTVLRDGPGWWLFGVVWGVAALGIVMETVFLNRWPALTLISYIAMGWIIVVVWKAFSSNASAETIAFLIAGGLAYTAGTVFYALGKRWGWFHIGWHLFVVAGTVLHFFSALAALPGA